MGRGCVCLLSAALQALQRMLLKGLARIARVAVRLVCGQGELVSNGREGKRVKTQEGVATQKSGRLFLRGIVMRRRGRVLVVCDLLVAE